MFFSPRFSEVFCFFPGFSLFVGFSAGTWRGGARVEGLHCPKSVVRASFLGEARS